MDRTSSSSASASAKQTTRRRRMGRARDEQMGLQIESLSSSICTHTPVCIVRHQHHAFRSCRPSSPRSNECLPWRGPLSEGLGVPPRPPVCTSPCPGGLCSGSESKGCERLSAVFPACIVQHANDCGFGLVAFFAHAYIVRGKHLRLRSRRELGMSKTMQTAVVRDPLVIRKVAIPPPGREENPAHHPGPAGAERALLLLLAR